MARQIITIANIDEALGRGESQLVLSESAIVTDAAAEHARDRGLSLVRPGQGGRATGSSLAEQVRQGVIAKLGSAPQGLDEAISRVLGK